MSVEIAAAAVGQAELLLSLHRYAHARTVLGAALAATPEEPEPWCLLAQACLGLEEFEAALEAAEQAAAVAPDAEWPHRLRSVALEQLGHRFEALEAAEDAVACAPESWAGHARVADLVSTDPATAPAVARHSTRALTAARTAVELAPDEPQAHLSLARAHARREEWREMRAAQWRALELAPDDADLHNDVAVNELRHGFDIPAGAGFARAAALDPRGPAGRNFGLTARLVFDTRMRSSVAALWVAAYPARLAAGSESPSTGLRLWAGAAVLALAAFFAKPLGDFVHHVGRRYRGALLAALRRNRRLCVQAGALTGAGVLALASLGLPSVVLPYTVGLSVACYVLAAVLTWFGGNGDRIVHGDPGHRR
jgi:tetratricopeptide (TPR) repeat protein